MLYGRCCRITVKKSIEWYKVGSSGLGWIGVACLGLAHILPLPIHSVGLFSCLRNKWKNISANIELTSKKFLIIPCPI